MKYIDIDIVPRIPPVGGIPEPPIRIIEIPEGKTIAMKISRYQASSQFSTGENENRGRMDLFGSTYHTSDFDLERVIVDFRGHSGGDRALRASYLPDLKIVAISISHFHRSDYIAILESGKPAAFWIQRNTENNYNLGVSHVFCYDDHEAKQV